MSYFDYTALVDGYTARASMFNPIFEAVKDGFEMLPTETQLKLGLTRYGADTGAANAHVVTLPYVPTAYTDGMEVRFKAAATNTGAATVNVNSLGVKTITRQSGATLQAGDILSGKMVSVVYNSTSGAFELQSYFADVLLKSLADAYAAAAAGSGVVISADDTTQGNVEDKITSTGGSLTFSTTSPGANEKRNIEVTLPPATAKTADYTISADQCRGNVLFTNTGASGAVIFSLPQGVSGMTVYAFTTAAQTIRINAYSGDYFRCGGLLSSSGGYVISPATANRFIKLTFFQNRWIVDWGLEWSMDGTFVLGGQVCGVSKTADYSPTPSVCLSGVTIDNTGATGEVIISLPAGSAGYGINAYVAAAQYLRIKANGSETIEYCGATTAAGGYIRCNSIGGYVSLKWIKTKWVAVPMIKYWRKDS